MASSLRCGMAGGGANGCTNLQLGQEGEDLQSMTRRWQLAHGTATMLPPGPELTTVPFFVSSATAATGVAAPVLPSMVGTTVVWVTEMLSSRFTLCFLGLIQLFFKVFLFRRWYDGERDSLGGQGTAPSRGVGGH